jgi:polyisoprenyl-teichoic acid--peptidoglycan teichoic acid transferase
MPRDPWDESRRDPPPYDPYSSRPRAGDDDRGRRPGPSGRPDPSARPGRPTPSGGYDDPRRTAWDRRRSADDGRARPDDRGGDPRRDPRHVRVGDPRGEPIGGPRHARSAGPGDDDGAAAGSRRRRHKRSWPQRLVLGAGLGLVLFCLLGASVAGYTLVKYESIDRVDDVDLASAADGEPENFLIVAVDTREGQGSRNTDTIMVVRVDPKSDRLALTSFPRDLMVTIADTGETGMINSAYARDAGGEQVLIDTLKQNFDITINHFVEVNFDSFKQVVDAVGGVSMWMPTAVRDSHSGFYSEQLGCVNLDGTQGLAFVRSRYMQILTEDGWDQDPFADVNRVQRQQVFIQRAMSKALGQVKSNPLRLRELVDIGVSNIRLDPNLGLGDILDLADKFKGFDAGKLEAYPLPTVAYPQDENRLLLAEAEAEPMLNVFRGLAPGEIRPGLVNVSVLNGTVADPAQQREGLATDVSGALQKVGFKMAAPDDADTFYAQTTIIHAPGEEAYAQRVARHISSPAAIPVVADPSHASGTVTVVAGVDFTTVHEQPTPIEAMPAPAGAAQPADTTVPAASTTTTTAPPPTTDTTAANPYIVGAPPEGAEC